MKWWNRRYPLINLARTSCQQPTPGAAVPTPEPTGDYVDLLLDRFEADWRAGRRPSVEQYLRDYSGPETARLVRELVCLDVIYRQRAGEPADPAEYAGRVPEFAQLPPADRAELAGDVERSAPAVVPVRIGKYRVLAKLADGGQAVTYRAYHEELHKPVVVKHARRPADPGGTPEGQMLAALAHPNIVRIYDADVHDGRPFVVLEDIPGRTLAEYAAAERPG